MDIKEMIASALRNFAPQPAPVVGGVKAALGQDGVAGRMNGDRREAYLQYVEREIAEGRQPVRFDQWQGTADPMTSQVGG